MNLTILDTLRSQELKSERKLKRRAGYNTSEASAGPEEMLKRMKVSSDSCSQGQEKGMQMEEEQN